MSAAVAQAIRSMMAAGLTLDQALLAVEKMDEAKRGSAKTNAERQAAWRARQKVETRNESNDRNVTNVTPSRDIQNAPTHAEPEPNKTTYPTTSEANASSVAPHRADLTLSGEILTPSPSPKPKPPPPSASRGCRLPPGFPGSSEREWCLVEMGMTDDDFADSADEFRDFWAGVPGQRGVKCDWPATFRNAVRKRFPRGGSRQAYAPRNQRQGGDRLGTYQRAAAFVRAQNDVPRERPGVLDL